MFMKLFFSVLLLYVIGNLLFYTVSKFHYAIHSTLIRKGLYTLFIAGLLVGLILGEIDDSDWKTILELAIGIIFIDLGVFQTPNILRIWSAEFQYANEIEENISMSKDRIQYMNRKSSFFSTIVQKAQDDLADNAPITSQEEFQNQLLDFVNQYADAFGFSTRVHVLTDDLEQEHEIKAEITQILYKTENLYNITIKDKQDVEASLFDAQSYVTSDERHAIIPIYEGDNNFLLTLAAHEGNIIEIDLFHIINLVILFQWHASYEKIML
ncbi:type II toxin-antitoxin system SpoIISA family toxin [Virgibacillus sp. 179-BFC.A HS]|uniref:Type II toxin-antitoxin system SpoIISA family toxin n=1 Tax=Tigheibacillus jepli TaxID=3035914 RepID=A0ABU5CDE5_9BACI|nr:type II toxin-antitoxin system SpoIISA family toxin [Virgibacillus sp. 179-BFC.A HS]MDY0404358.1 type II toxin-antitoxin system SpoIISA family toxin [Virgibacillus sp. 179-BFC.A HS]